MHKSNKMVSLLVTAALVTGPIAGSAYAETAASQRVLSLTPLQESLSGKQASNVSHATPGHVIRFLDDPLHMPKVEQAHDFYYLVPKADLGANNYLELVWTQSELLIPTQSTLTVMIDDMPLKSVFLDGQTRQLQIPLGSSHLTPGYHKVTVWKHSLVSDDLCTDEYNPANWVRIEPTTSVFLDTQAVWSTGNPLKEFPHPFVEQGALDEVYGAIVLPDSASAGLIASALELATHLSMQTNGKRHVPILTESEWTAGSTIPHAIALGSTDSWTGSVKQAVDSVPRKAAGEELLLQYYAVADGQAADRQLLLVTAEAEQVIAEKLHVLTDSTLTGQLTGTQAVIAETPKREVSNPGSRSLTFASAGYADLLLNDVNNHAANLFITVPSYWKMTGDSWLNLKLKVSPLLLVEDNKTSKKASRHTAQGLTLTINDIPKTISLDELKQLGSDSDSYNLRIPLEPNMMPGGDNGNAIRINIAANISEVSGACFKERNDGRWIFIDKESGLEMPYEVSKDASFKYWPAPFVNDQGINRTAFLVPQNVDGKFLTQLSMVASELVTMTQNESSFAVVQEPLDAKAEETLKDHNIIVLGDLSQYPSLQAAKDRLLLTVNSGPGRFLNYSVIAEMADYAAWVQPSVWNEEYALAVFQATDEQVAANGQMVHPRLLSSLKQHYIAAQIAVMSKSEEVFFPDANEEPQAVAVSSTAEKPGDQPEEAKPIPMWIWILISVQFFAMLFVVVKLWRRREKDRQQ